MHMLTNKLDIASDISIMSFATKLIDGQKFAS